MSWAYYNENDPHAAAWLNELQRQGNIAPGVVDNRSIKDVVPSDLAEFTQCHFFAGIGVWSFALRLAGWPDDWPCWTGSCPCQPFSVAGKGLGKSDERHLWPVFSSLIAECRPTTVLGEQVASKAGRDWFSSLRIDLEKLGYAVGAADLCAAGVGAPHVRQRLYWVADSGSAGIRDQRRGQDAGAAGGSAGQGIQWERFRDVARHAGRSRLLRLADTPGEGHEGCSPAWAARQGVEGSSIERGLQIGGMADAECSICGIEAAPADNARKEANGPADRACRRGGTSIFSRATNGHWRDADWLFCRDGKWRAVEPGAFPLANGAPARVGRLRGYGNAIVAQQAQAFIEVYMEFLKLGRGGSAC